MTKEMTKKVVTRFAPSPTGFMHVGGVRTALFAWAYARKFGSDGTFILRIEDTDKKREVDGSITHIIESLKWLGITWNEGPDIGGPNGPYIQSQRLDSYRKYAQILIEKGLAYADPYTVEELDAFRKKAEEEKRPFHYRDHRPENPPAWIDKDGERKPLRLKMTDIKESHWHDLVRGDLKAGPEALDDFILIKSDGYPTYNFAHIIDDLHMGATHIIRADEFISSIPNYLALYEALGIKENPDIEAGEIQRPQMAILPPIVGPDGKKKLSKRDGAKDILEYRTEGYLPEALVNFLAFIGWNPGTETEIMSPEEIIKAFELSQIQSAGGKLNEEKLTWTNREHLVRLGDSEWLEKLYFYMETYCSTNPDGTESVFNIKREFADRSIDTSTDFFKRILIEVFRDRVSYFGELKAMLENGEFDYYFNPPLFNPASEGVTLEAVGSAGNDSEFKALIICPEKLRKNGTGEKIPVDAESTIKMLSQAAQILEKHFAPLSANDSAGPAQPLAWNKESIKEALWPFADHEGRGVVLWPMRVALSGVAKSPDPFMLAGILGKEETLKRLSSAIEALA